MGQRKYVKLVNFSHYNFAQFRAKSEFSPGIFKIRIIKIAHNAIYDILGPLLVFSDIMYLDCHIALSETRSYKDTSKVIIYNLVTLTVDRIKDELSVLSSHIFQV